MLENFRNSARFQINGRLAEIQRACDLDEEQLKRLIAASKGALKNLYNNEKEEKEQMLKRYQQQAGIDVDDEDDGDEEELPMVRNFAFIVNFKSGDSIEEEPLWVNSLGKILTDEQKEKLENVRKAQEQHLKKAAVEQFVARCEVQLFLSPEQRDQIKKMVDEHLADIVVRPLYHTPPRARAIEQFTPPDESSQYGDMVKEFLSEEQLKAWNRLVEPEIKELQRLPRR